MLGVGEVEESLTGSERWFTNEQVSSKLPFDYLKRRKPRAWKRLFSQLLVFYLFIYYSR